MKKVKAAKVAGGKTVLSVKADNNVSKKFDANQAKTIEAEPIEEVKAEETPQEQPHTTPEIQPTEAPTPTTEKKQELAPVEAVERKRIPTMQELKDCATTLYLLQDKHTKLLEKRSSLNKFAITHEKENAEVVVTDANGEEFTSRSPKTIAKLIEFWKEEFDEAIQAVEEELKKMFLGANAAA